MPKKISQEEVQKKIDSFHHGSVVIVSNYSNTSNKCTFNNPNCDHPTWERNPFRYAYSSGVGCPKCANRNIQNSNLRSRKR